MAHVITSRCVGTCDTACVTVCPMECIDGPTPLATLRALPVAERGKRHPGLQLYIDADDCIDCGACLDVCPARAIEHDSDAPAVDVAANLRFFAERRARR